MSVSVTTGLTYDDLAGLPQDDGLRRELIDVDRVDVHRLTDDGRYGLPATLGPGAGLTCLAAPGLTLPVADLFR